MSVKTVYLVVRVAIQTDTEMSSEDLENVVNELDYSFTHDAANVVDTEIMASLEKPPVGI